MSRCSGGGILLAVASVLACSRGTEPAAQPAPPQAPSPQAVITPTPSAAEGADCPAPDAGAPGDDWTGRYQASEGANAEGFAPQVMVYEADVFRDDQGRWRAFVSISGQTVYRALAACGIPRARTLELRGVRARSDNVSDFSAGESILTIERQARGALVLRIPDGSYLMGQPVLKASRRTLAPWAGRYVFDSCAGPSPARDTCWRHEIDVRLGDEGWGATISVAGPHVTERYLARGEDYELMDEGSVLGLTFLGYAPGDAHRGPDREPDQEVGRLVRKGTGATAIRFGTLPAPPGMTEAATTRTDRD
jgi:hypothetical protein